jgi:hypothetical protein
MCWMREEKEEEEIVVIYQSLKGDELSRLTRCSFTQARALLQTKQTRGVMRDPNRRFGVIDVLPGLCHVSSR